MAVDVLAKVVVAAAMVFFELGARAGCVWAGRPTAVCGCDLPS